MNKEIILKVSTYYERYHLEYKVISILPFQLRSFHGMNLPKQLRKILLSADKIAPYWALGYQADLLYN